MISIAEKIKDMYSSFFFKLLAGFMVVILIMTIFIIFTFKFYKENLQNEIVRNSNSVFYNNSQRYDDYFSKLQSAILEVNSDSNIQAIIRSSLEFESGIHDCIRILSSKFSNIPHIERSFLYIQNKNLIITAEGTFHKSSFFNYHYTSNKYNELFWNNLLTESFSLKFLDSAVFTTQTANSTKSLKRPLLPLVLKNKNQNDYLLVVLVRIDSLNESIYMPPDKNFFILGENNRLIYNPMAAIDQVQQPLDLKKYKTGINSPIIFEKKSAISDLKYFKICPFTEIEEQMSKLNVMLFLMLILALVVSFIISIFISYKFNNPIFNIVKAIKVRNTELPDSSCNNDSRNEFKFIRTAIQSMFEENHKMGKDLHYKNSLLKYYFIHNRIKNMDSSIKQTYDFGFSSKLFVIVLYKIIFTKAYNSAFESKSGNISAFFSNYFDLAISGSFSDSVTFQIEKNQYVSVISLDSEADLLKLADTLKSIVNGLKNDKDYLILHIAYSKPFEDMSIAYKEAAECIKHASLGNDTQILTGADLTKNNSFYFTLDQERQIAEAMYIGDNPTLIKLVDHVLDDNIRRGVDGYYINKLSVEILNNFIKTANLLKIETSNLLDIRHMYDQLDSFTTIEHYKDFIHNIISQFTEYIKYKKKDKDYIIEYVTEYINRNYTEDIYLDLLAEKLNISSSYLSSYIKEKLGINFIDYLNNIRINKAKVLLKNNDMKINDVAVKVGYRSAHTFIRCFKRFTKVTPTEFKRLNNLELTE